MLHVDTDFYVCSASAKVLSSKLAWGADRDSNFCTWLSIDDYVGRFG